jgi:hypothetical protein
LSIRPNRYQSQSSFTARNCPLRDHPLTIYSPRENEAIPADAMGIIRTEFANPVNRSLQPVKALTLVDTGALHLCLPEHIAIQLGLRELEIREVTLANGHRITVPYCGPVEIQLKTDSRGVAFDSRRRPAIQSP